MNILLALLLATSSIIGSNAQCQSSLSWKFPPGMKDGSLKSSVIASMTKPRGIRFINDTLLVVDVGVGLVSLVEGGENCSGGWTKTVLVQNPDLNHGIVVNGTTQIYASTVNSVFRYNWNAANRTISGNTQIITGMDLAANHKTRTLDISGNYLLVSSGASENLETESSDPSHGTAQVRRFALNAIPAEGYTWFQGELVAKGMRNAVGLAVTRDGSKLWTVENSADQLNYTTGGQLVDVHLDNPAEELNLVDLSDIGHSYGYPECFTAWKMKDVVPNSPLNLGDQFSIAPNVTDAQCGNTTFNKPPRLSMQAHSAPLDIVFYNAPSSTTTGVKTDYNSHAFVTFHGSWNRDPPTGYGIVRIPWSGEEPSSASNAEDGYSFVLQADLTKCPDGCVRPVGLAFDSAGRLFGSSDSTGEIFLIQASSASKLVGITNWVWFTLAMIFMTLLA